MIPAEGERPSYGELAALVVTLTARLDVLEARVVELEAENAQLKAENAELRAENAELRRQVGRNSRNSSQPPSADGLAKPPPKSMRGRSGRRPGKQPGTSGTALMQVDCPTWTVPHLPSACGGCGGDLTDATPAGVAVIRQVFDIPEVKAEVTAHELHALACGGCGTVTRAAAPAFATAPAVYGPRVSALAAYLSAQHHIPVGRVAEVLADLAGIEVSTGWISDTVTKVAQVLAPVNARIRDAIAAASVAHFDESVTRVSGRNHWLHVAATPALTAYHIDAHGRGTESITAFGILPRFTGVAVHDAYRSYQAFEGCTHALCNAHIVREAAGIGEYDLRARADGWAEALVLLLGDGYRWVAAWRDKGHDRLPDFKLKDLSQRFDDLVERALTAHSPRGTGKQSPARNLALRLRTRKSEVLRFATDFTVAYSNNVAEQAIRMIKTKTKVSGGFRTLKGAQTFLAIRGYISTVRKNGLRAAHALHDALLGNPWMPALTR
ncbi:IS66 family transposase [Streptosporangium sp. NBC_01755]|uniref:IS66 family transposase n=1 Tax=Streptosporangium sp. NBC_01755 TaxID=2975949 RepID=UPI002DDA762F|nr:IS66 family transposase [Streptosporangium sp. NBC_01755]WSD01312.1 IS66 family transposase [Streptosporangium sp. NBC_01755]